MRVMLRGGVKAGADAMLDVLKKYKTIAVVGLSSNPMRPSYDVTEYMQAAGYRIIPVNPNERKVLGEKSYARLEEVPEKIEIVNVFRRGEGEGGVGGRGGSGGGGGGWRGAGGGSEGTGGKGAPRRGGGGLMCGRELVP